MDWTELCPELCSLPVRRPSGRPWKKEPTEQTTDGFINQLFNLIRSMIARSPVGDPWKTCRA